MDSIKERIVKHMVMSLEQITKDNGYSMTLAPGAVQRFYAHGQTLANPPLILTLEGEDRASDGALMGVSSLTQREFDLFVDLHHVLDPDADPRSGDELMNDFRAAVERAVMTDRTRGGLAIDTKPPDWGPIETEEGTQGLFASGQFRIQYRHLDKNPASPV